MLRKLPGLIWTVAIAAWAAKRFLPPDAITSVKAKVQGATATVPTDVPAPEGADLHTPMPVA